MELEKFLNSLNEEVDDIVEITNRLGDIAMFDDDGEFAHWEKSEVDAVGKSNFETMKSKFVSYAKKLGFNTEASAMYLLFAAQESEVDSEQELKDLAAELEEYK